MGCTMDVISIGTLSSNLFWREAAGKRAAHATTSLIRDGDVSILVDPSLPAEMLACRLDERAGMRLSDIDVVFLTCFRPVHRRSLEAFDRAQWQMSEEELAAVTTSLSAALEDLSRAEGVSEPEEIERELDLAGRITAAPDKLTPSVDLFPSPGASVGSAGLLVAGVKTAVVAGDAILTRDHFVRGRVFERSADPEAAKQSFQDIIEVADIIVPGHDNMIVGM